MPEPFRVFLLMAQLAALSPVAAMEVGIFTINGMSFRGIVSRISGEELLLESTGTVDTPQIGIPLESVRRIQLPTSTGDERLLLSELETMPSLLRFLDQDGEQRVLAALENLAEAGRWHQLHEWTRRLGENSFHAARSLRVDLLQAWALLELGLRGESRKLVRDLAERADPLAADPLLCWLAARHAWDDSQTEEALFWAEVPLLRIPPEKGPYVARIQLLLREMDPGEKQQPGNQPEHDRHNQPF